MSGAGPAVPRRRRVVLGASAAGLVALGLPPLVDAAASGTVTIFAAASLADVMMAIGTRPGRAGPPIRFSFAASSTLARQIEQGATADIFISADEAWMDHLARRGRIVADTRRDLARNRLVVVQPGTPGDGEPPESVAALRDALVRGGPPERVATGDPAHVPAGRYAEAALRRLGLWTEIEPRLVRADNVRSALAFVERGEVAAGIVYATDALLSRKVRVAARFPETSHPPIRYPAALVVGAVPEARAVLAEFFTPAARGLLRTAGFGKP